MASVLLLNDFGSLAGALGARFLTGAGAFLAGTALTDMDLSGVAFFAGVVLVGLTAGALAVVALVGFAFVVVFLTAGFLAGAGTADFVVFFSVAVFVAVAPALAFQPNRFNLPTTAFLLMPNFLPISDVDKPLPIRAFNFFSAVLSQPLLILYQPLLYFLWYNSITVPNRKARGKNMIWQIFFIILLGIALWCAWQISRADLRRRIIPDAFLWPLMLIGLLITNWFVWPVGPRGAAIGAAFGYALAAGTGFVFDAVRRWKNPDASTPIGMGDIKLIATGGVWAGVQGVSLALIVACVTGAVWATAKHQKYIPFAPFFITGIILALITMAFLI